jgi:hypothetical protein
VEPASQADPRSAAGAYLDARVDVEPTLRAPAVDEAAGLATVEWTVSQRVNPAEDPAPLTSGKVFLRRVAGRWVVTGATDDEVFVRDPAFREGAVSFRVLTPEGSDSVEWTVTADGREVGRGDVPAPAAGTSAPATARVPAVLERGAPIVRLLQVGGSVLSVAEFRVEPDLLDDDLRLITSGMIGDAQWWLASRAEDAKQCFYVNGVPGGNGGGCETNELRMGDGRYHSQVGFFPANNGYVLWNGFAGPTVDAVRLAGLGVETGAVWDPLHPSGPRYFAVVTPVPTTDVTIEFLEGDRVATRLDWGRR